MNPPFHPPSVCPSVNLSSFHLPHTETRQWGPHPSSVFQEISALPGALISKWGTRFCICTSFPKIYLSFVQTPLFPVLCFRCHCWRPAFLFGHTQPMSPLVRELLLLYPRRHHLYLLSLKFRPHMATRTPHRQNRTGVIHGTGLIPQHCKRVKNYTK
jgi:hypothetical protein